MLRLNLTGGRHSKMVRQPRVVQFLIVPLLDPFDVVRESPAAFGKSSGRWNAKMGIMVEFKDGHPGGMQRWASQQNAKMGIMEECKGGIVVESKDEHQSGMQRWVSWSKAKVGIILEY